MARIITAATDLFQPVEVELWGRTYTVTEPTRAVERKHQDALDAAEKLPDDASDEQFFDAEVEILDVLLEPAPVEDGKKLRAKTHLTQLYKQGKIGRGHVERLYMKIAEARDANDPN